MKRKKERYKMTVQEIIYAIKRETGIELPKDQTCDQLMAGSPDMKVKKIACTFMATVDVIREAARQGINMIITHEPTWFTGKDDTEWLKNDPVYLEKKKLIEESRIAIWRFHDHMHMGKEDGIYRGFDQEFGWKPYRVDPLDNGEFLEQFGACYELPETTLRELCMFFKKKLEMQVVQIVGNPDMKVKRVSVLVGGGSLGLGQENLPMIHMKEKNIDVAICGDITEWTLSAYVRDAEQMGMNKGMLILGHERSEECGMKHMVEWLKPLTNGIEAVFIDAKEPFLYI